MLLLCYVITEALNKETKLKELLIKGLKLLATGIVGMVLYYGIMKLVLMLDESRGLNEEDRIRSAFRIPETREEHDVGMELFNSYARGGIEYMYEMLVVRPGSPDDEYGDQRINNIIALLNDSMESSEL